MLYAILHRIASYEADFWVTLILLFVREASFARVAVGRAVARSTSLGSQSVTFGSGVAKRPATVTLTMTRQHILLKGLAIDICILQDSDPVDAFIYG